MIEKIDFKKMAKGILENTKYLEPSEDSNVLFSDKWMHYQALECAENSLFKCNKSIGDLIKIELDPKEFKERLETEVLKQDTVQLSRLSERTKEKLKMVQEWDKELDRMLQKKSTLS